MLQIDREHIEELVTQKPVLLQDIGRAIEERRESLRRAWPRQANRRRDEAPNAPAA